MKYITIFLIAILILTACQPVEPTLTPFLELSTPSPTSTPEPTLEPTQEPTAMLDISAYQVQFGEVVCDLELLDGEENLYLTDCTEALYFPLNSTVIIKLIPPADEEFKLYAIKGFAEIIEIYFPGIIIGEFVDSETENQAGCYIPYLDKAGEELVCGFNYLNNEWISVLLEGVTTRLGGGSNISGEGSDSSGNNSGEEKPPNTGH